MSAAELAGQLQALGHDVTVVAQGGQDYALFPFIVPAGRARARQSSSAFRERISRLTRPAGRMSARPSTTPRATTTRARWEINGGTGAVPTPGGRPPARTAADYMAHIRRLFSQIT